MVANTATMRTDLDRAAQNLNSNAAKMNKSLARIDRSFQKSRRAAARFAKGLAAGAFAAATAGLTLVGRSSVRAADGLAKAARTADISGERFQTLTFAFSQMGIEARQTEEGLRRFGRRMGEFVNSGAGPAQKAIEALNIGIRDMNGDLLPTEQVLDQTLRALAAIDEPTRRAAFAAQLFGDDAGPRLALAVSQGTGAIADLEKQARDLGLVLSNDTLSNAEKLNDQFSILSQTIRAKFTAALLENAPAINTLTNGLIKLIEVSGKGVNALSNFFALDETKTLTDRAKELERDLKLYRRNLEDAKKQSEGFWGFLAPGQEWLEKTRAKAQAARDELFEVRKRLTELNQTAPPIPSTESAPDIEDISVRARNQYQSLKIDIDDAFNPGPLQNFRAALDDVGLQMELGVISAAQQIEDSFVQLATTGKLSFKEMSNFIISEIVRIAVRSVILKPLLNFLGGGDGGDGGGLFGGARAAGGPVEKGKTYLVGEKGPELFVAGQSGTIYPNSGAPQPTNNAMGGRNVTVNIDARGAQDGLVDRLRATVVSDVVPLITATVDGRIGGLSRPTA